MRRPEPTHHTRGTTREGRPGDRPPAGSPLIVPLPLFRRLCHEAEGAYPGESCGVLLGETLPEERRVLRIESTENRWSDRDDRYLVDPGALLRLLEEEERGGSRILGFYHSHPDAAPVPSVTDRSLAWPWYHYLIVRVDAGHAGQARVWELVDGAFVERSLLHTREPVEPACGSF